ncbi:DUF1330 domain-containing protein (plasmid) [Paroceanicella profunda]|uniref:DUF1330 domain-containing protein n=1 Tax=Paroceanicella profunda TaxID=2579971 RepID=A0A5B8G0H0_9RHOB|nr:DUF1330 domain-containing protein [Paroceanicella profunda]QDL94215.1 DUF1330 domain-containing protein [Paroceanicella profunda]
MKGYWLVLGAEVTDAEAQQAYGGLWKPIAQRYGARVNPPEVQAALLEAYKTTRFIIVEFPSFEDARACHDDPEYAPARDWAAKASQREIVLLRGDLG